MPITSFLPLVLAFFCACGTSAKPSVLDQHPSATLTPAIGESSGTTVATRFSPPENCNRIEVAPNSFGAYLRAIPLKPAGTNVILYNGTQKSRQDVHAAVIDISVGEKDLQQCADAIIRLRAEYLYSSGKQGEITFNFTNGFAASWKRWSQGERINVTGNRCAWMNTAKPDDSHEQLLNYLERVFTYAGTLSLSKELKPCSDKPMQIGDVFIHGGSPGHAVVVFDIAKDEKGRTYFMLAQSYMPAQNIHVLQNLGSPELGAWFLVGEGDQLRTPEWTFDWSDRKCW
ncbi:MAG: DUF4846 domain-containing protein [Flavobacteriales bacterium]|nr:DUF4846 domain-containing protein [Flavobacteriales bacterium]